MIPGMPQWVGSIISYRRTMHNGIDKSTKTNNFELALINP